jgi:ribosomal protein S18 acetylase RimI-like enzyme
MPSVSERGLAVHRAAANDEPFILRLAEQAFAEYDLDAARTTQHMLRSGATTLVATRDAKPIGFAIVRRESTSALSLDAIAVSPNERGKRVGELLLAAVELHARRVAVARVTLRTAQANVAALSLFLRAGFAITRRFARGYRGGQPTCALEKRL